MLCKSCTNHGTDPVSSRPVLSINMAVQPPGKSLTQTRLSKITAACHNSPLFAICFLFPLNPQGMICPPFRTSPQPGFSTRPSLVLAQTRTTESSITVMKLWLYQTPTPIMHRSARQTTTPLDLKGDGPRFVQVMPVQPVLFDLH